MTCSPAFLQALSALNIHARAHGSGKKAIYAYKTLTACAYAEEARPVMVMARCHHCAGTGIYRDWDGYQRGPCYRCTKGVATLRFIESRIGETRWHHPYAAGGSDVLHAVWDIVSMRYDQPTTVAVLADGTERPVSFAQAEGWDPNMPADKQPTDEACRLLNLVEAAIPDIPADRRETRWKREAALREMVRYQISLDRIAEGCCFCGAPHKLTNCCSLRWGFGFVNFARPVCDACRGMSGSLHWPTEPHPASLSPNVVEWLAHPGRQWPREAERE